MACPVKEISTKRGKRYVEVLPSGRYRFIKKSVYESRKSTKSASKKSEGKKVARRRRSSRNLRKRARTMTFPLSIIIGVLSSIFAKPRANWDSPFNAIRKGNFEDAMKVSVMGWTGYDYGAGKFLQFPQYPIILGLCGMVHKYVGGSLGVNRALGRARVPLLRV